MKNLSLLLLVSVVLCGVANAAIVDCGTSVYSYAQWSTEFVGAGNGCAIGDKIFSNFSTGSIPNDTGMQFGSTVLAGGALFTVNFIRTTLGGFNSDFTESYTIEIDPAKAQVPTWIAAVAGGMQDSNGNGNAVLTKVITGGATGMASATDVNGVITPVVLKGLNATTPLNVTDSYKYTSGVITNISNTFGEVNAPEPASMALIGGGLLALCFARRRRA